MNNPLIFIYAHIYIYLHSCIQIESMIFYPEGFLSRNNFHLISIYKMHNIQNTIILLISSCFWIRNSFSLLTILFGYWLSYQCLYIFIRIYLLQHPYTQIYIYMYIKDVGLCTARNEMSWEITCIERYNYKKHIQKRNLTEYICIYI